MISEDRLVVRDISVPGDISAERAVRWFLPGAVVLLGLLFLAAPWPLHVKAHAVLHGLCAQTPDHTYVFGGTPLPFDARMTGIYGGAIAAAIWFVGKGRYRATHYPPLSVVSLLALGVGAMAIDGLNSLAVDLEMMHVYEPQNWLRTLTGMGAGIAISSVLCYLTAITIWRRPDPRQSVLGSAAELGQLWLMQIPFTLLLFAGVGWIGTGITFLLLVSALMVVGTMALVSAVLWRRAEQSFEETRELRGWAAFSLIAAAGVILALAGLRFGLERWLGVAATA